MIWFGQPSHKISFQKKKGKKRKPSFHVEGFKKASFSDKILPLISEQYSVAVFRWIMFMRLLGWRFYLKPKA
ncbi:hypothetical protein DI487_12850 [Flavobacterium sediminis]|uniref:Uncharacterized protein n=1 Tax=Flavobacterium sediminis TaxID=2201181 RepID=A0A2U8QXW5_9FLAO|nr:hypothetical protein DI487_12850 [Flavobacterium sediminis]